MPQPNKIYIPLYSTTFIQNISAFKIKLHNLTQNDVLTDDQLFF